MNEVGYMTATATAASSIAEKEEDHNGSCEDDNAQCNHQSDEPCISHINLRLGMLGN
jgi:hypothetical protein